MSELSPEYHRGSVAAPTLDEVLSSPTSSSWLKDALRSSLPRDPVDAARDAELLALVLSSRADLLLGMDAMRLGLSSPRC